MKRFVSNFTGMLKATFVVLVITFFSVQLSASHISGAGITYKSLGSGKYYIESFVIRDCRGAGYSSYTETVDAHCTSNASSGWTSHTVTHLAFVAPNPVPFGGSYSGITITAGSNQVVAEEISSVCDSLLNPNIWPNSSCRGRTNTAQGHMMFRFSAIITLSSCNWWRLGFSPPSGRNTGSSNTRSGGIYVHTLLNTKDYPNNSAPKFNDEHKPFLAACVGQEMSYAAGGTDFDGDSLIFELTCGMQDSTRCVTYNTGFSATAPIPGIRMDTNTGLITFTPRAAGKRIINYWVKEYDKCTRKIKAKTLRDIMIRIETCSNKVPSVSNKISNLKGKAFVDSKGVINVVNGDKISWDETFIDSNITDSIHFRTTLSDALPGATYEVLAGSNRYVQIVRYTWTANMGKNSNKIFSTFFNDDFCPFPGYSATATELKVLAAINISPKSIGGEGDSLYACIGDTVTVSGSGATRFNWVSISGDPLILGINWFLDTNKGLDTGATAKLIVTQTTVLQGSAAQAKDECGRVVPGVTLADTLTIFARDSFSVANVLDTILCLPDTNYLSIKTSKPSGNYTYLWSPAQYLNYDTISKPRLVGLSGDQLFNVRVTSDSGCTRNGSVNVTASAPLPKGSFVTEPDSFLCIGDTLSLKLNIGDIDYGSCEAVGTQCFGNLYKDSVGKVDFVSDTLALVYPLVYSATQKSGKMQFVYTANLLKSYGLKKGLLTSIGFNLDAVPFASTVFNEFTIKMTCTSNSNATSFSSANMAEVFYPKNYTPVVGWNTHNFDRDFAWDGNSNILVEICWIMDTKQTRHPKMKFYSAGYACSRTYTQTSDSTACAETALGTTSFMLPVTQFGTCSGTISSNYKFSWSSNTAGRSSGFISGLNADSVQIATGVNTARDYLVTISDTSNACSETIPVKVKLRSSYNTKPDSIAPLCIGSGNVQLKAPTPNNVSKPGGKWSGAGIVDNRNGLWDSKKSGVGTFYVVYVLTGNNCASKDSTQITVSPSPDGSILPIDFICGKEGLVPQHEVKGKIAGGTFFGPEVQAVNVGGSISYLIDGTKFNTSGGNTDTAAIRHVVRQGQCITDTTIKIPVLAHWDSTYLGVYNNGLPIFTDKFCATSGSDTLAVRGKHPIWRMVDPQNKSAIVDSVNGVFNPSLINNGKGGKVEIEVENNGFCGAKGRFFVDLNAAPQVRILTEDFCFKVPGNCIGSNVPTAKQMDTLLVRVAKYPYTKIDDTDTSTYVDVVNATPVNTGWSGLKGGNATRWNGYFWMNFSDRCAHRFCSLPPNGYPISYRTAISYRPWKTDSICYSVDSTSIFMDNNFKLTLTKTGSLCNDGTVELEVSASAPGTAFVWNDGSTITKKTVNKAGVYKVAAFYKYCDSKDSVEVTSCVGLEEIESTLNAKLFPNPARDKVSLKAVGLSENVKLNIMASSGQLIDEFNFEQVNGSVEEEIDVSFLPRGVYLFQVSSQSENNIYRVIME